MRAQVTQASGPALSRLASELFGRRPMIAVQARCLHLLHFSGCRAGCKQLWSSV